MSQSIQERNLVRLDQHGLDGSNYYWVNRKRLGYSDEELIAVGMSSPYVLVDRGIIQPLNDVNLSLKSSGRSLFIKEGYRSPALYRLAYERYAQKHGKARADRLFNLSDMPHATGLSVDVVVLDASEQPIYYRDGDDDPEGCFVDFYKSRTDDKGKAFHQHQVELITLMQENGFRLGKKREYWHFDYLPYTALNYLDH